MVLISVTLDKSSSGELVCGVWVLARNGGEACCDLCATIAVQDMVPVVQVVGSYLNLDYLPHNTLGGRLLHGKSMRRLGMAPPLQVAGNG